MKARTVKDLCEFYGIGQTELARRFDIPRRTVQDWHAGRRTPPDYVAMMMEELLLRDRLEDARKSDPK
jgi:DNA-binding transcriptional regulator YiaG